MKLTCMEGKKVRMEAFTDPECTKTVPPIEGQGGPWSFNDKVIDENGVQEGVIQDGVCDSGMIFYFDHDALCPVQCNDMKDRESCLDLGYCWAKGNARNFKGCAKL